MNVLVKYGIWVFGGSLVIEMIYVAIWFATLSPNSTRGFSPLESLVLYAMFFGAAMMLVGEVLDILEDLA